MKLQLNSKNTLNKLNKILASMQNTNSKVNPQGTVKLNVRHDNKRVLKHISIL